LITDKIIEKDVEMDKPVLLHLPKKKESPRKTFMGEVLEREPTEKDLIRMAKKERSSEIKEKMQRLVD
jgi:hypothetical protein